MMSVTADGDLVTVTRPRLTHYPRRPPDWKNDQGRRRPARRVTPALILAGWSADADEELASPLATAPFQDAAEREQPRG